MALLSSRPASYQLVWGRGNGPVQRSERCSAVGLGVRVERYLWLGGWTGGERVQPCESGWHGTSEEEGCESSNTI